MVEIENLSLSYENSPKVLKDIYLNVKKGECVLFTGKSGSGKSSIINSINGLAVRYDVDTMIEKLSRYIKSAGKDYQDHYVTILNWYEQDKDKLTQRNKSNIPTWEEYDKGEHL